MMCMHVEAAKDRKEFNGVQQPTNPVSPQPPVMSAAQLVNLTFQQRPTPQGAKKFLQFVDSNTTTEQGYCHDCPACKAPHYIRTQRSENRPDAPCWDFNHDFQRPTFHPSILCYWTTKDDKGKDVRKTECHYFIVDGEIRFCGDNPHAFNGKTVPLPEYDDR